MKDATQELPKTLPANLEALKKELEELFFRTRKSQPEARKNAEPALFTAGK